MDTELTEPKDGTLDNEQEMAHNGLFRIQLYIQFLGTN